MGDGRDDGLLFREEGGLRVMESGRVWWRVRKGSREIE